MVASEAPSLPRRISVWILSVAVAGAPLPFGSRDEATVALWCALLGFGVILAPTRQLRPPHYWMLAGIAAIVVAFGFVLHEQLSAAPWIAPFHPIWQEASKLLGTPLQPSVSVAKGEPFYTLGAPLANVLALVLGLLVGADRHAARRVLQIAAWAGAIYAAYGLYGMMFSPNTVLWREKVVGIGNVTGTFINRNTAATYFGSCAVIWLLLFLEELRNRLPPGRIDWNSFARRVLENNRDVQPRFWLSGLMLVLCLAALFGTSSRAGTLVSLLGMALAFTLYFYRHLAGVGQVVFALIVAGSLGWGLLLVMGGGVTERLDTEGLEDLGRLSVWPSTLRMIADHPWFGVGLGNFAAAFPPYRDPLFTMYGVWDRAHSTPLELAAEIGVPLTAIIAAGWFVALGSLLRGSIVRKREKIVPLSAFSVCLIGLLHSSADFSLQVAGYAIVAFGVLGVGLAQSVRPDHKPVTGNRRVDDINVHI